MILSTVHIFIFGQIISNYIFGFQMECNYHVGSTKNNKLIHCTYLHVRTVAIVLITNILMNSKQTFDVSSSIDSFKRISIAATVAISNDCYGNGIITESQLVPHFLQHYRNARIHR